MEAELEELRLELKTARSDVKRYASYVLRLQRELAREKQKRDDDNSRLKNDGIQLSHARENCIQLSDTTVWDDEVLSSSETHKVWRHKIDRILRLLNAKPKSSRTRGERIKNKRSGLHQDGKWDETCANVMLELQPFLQQQQQFIADLGRENAKLRGMLTTRPTRRELLCSQVEVERLQGQLRKLRARAKNDRRHDPKDEKAKTDESKDSIIHEPLLARDPSLTERIAKDKLLKALRVKTENSATQHPYLKKKVHCYLLLDTTRLVKEHGGGAEEAIVQRVGQICSDIVASCCYALEVEEVGELPRYVEKSRQLAQLASVYQSFTERLTKLLKRFDMNVFSAMPTGPITKTTHHEVLEEILSQTTDALVELDARRDQMKPPGSTAHEVLMKSMKLLNIARIDELVPTLRRLIENMRAEQTFLRDLRELFGLDDNATRKQVFDAASILFDDLGFPADATNDQTTHSRS